MSRLVLSRVLFCSALTFAMTCTVLVADDSQVGLKTGEAIGAFYVTKVAGAEDDGVQPGDDLCYRCRYGSSPMVMVFARNTGGKVPELVKQLDSAVAANEDYKLRGLMTLMGEDAAVLREDAKKIAEASGAKKVPFVVAKENKTGPVNYKLPEAVEVSIVVAKDSQVVATHCFDADKIDVATLLKDVKGMLN